MKRAYVAAVCVLAAGGQAAAQTKIEEIVVTAKNRTERLQDVPLSISAFSADVLRANQVLDVRDLQRITPALNAYSFTGRSDPNGLSLRGVAPNTSDERYQGVSFFLDGVALSGQLTSLDLANLERVEVIKGPQSATFGRATYSGAISYISKEPEGDEVTGDFKMRGGFSKKARGPDLYAGGNVAFPVVQDRFWMSVEGSALKTAAMFRDPQYGNKIAEETSRGIASVGVFRPSDNLKVRARLSYDRDEDTAPPTYAQHPRDWLLAGVPTVVLPRASGSFWPTVMPDPKPGFTADTITSANIYQPQGGNTRDRYFGSLIVTYDYNGTELSYRSGYFYSRDEKALTFARRSIAPGIDPVFGPLVTANQVTITATGLNPALSALEKFKNTSQQIMAVSPSDEAFRWRIGGYYFYEADKNWQNFQASAINPTGRRAGLESIENIAGFGAVDYDFTDSLTLSAEGRLAEETIGWDECRFCGQVTLTDNRSKRSDFLPRVTLTYKPSDQHMIYALFSSGTKGGRYSFIANPGSTTGTLVFAEPESLDNYEIGTKNTFWDGRAVVNLSAYLAKVKKQQLVTAQLFITPSGAVTNVNIAQNVGTSRVPGFELETQFAVTDNFNLSGGLGYAGQRFTTKNLLRVATNTSVLFPGTALGDPISIDGKTQGSIPRWNGSVSGDYTVEQIFGDYDLLAHVDVNYRGKLFADLANITVVRASWKVNARLALNQGPMEVALTVRNLLNDRRALGSGLAGNTSACTFLERDTARFGSNQQCLFATVARPRQVGLEARYDF